MAHYRVFVTVRHSYYLKQTDTTEEKNNADEIDEILKQRDKYHADNMETMSINDYRAFLETGALIEKDQHGFVRCALSGEMLAVNPEQIDALIEFLKEIRD
ncbi:hypothetical protein [Escherichia coli]|uniref:hypothetical protein n=3 Tax=Escherichia coli TaxID=562 RepID=UPI000DAC0A76|nr:hypothetical protein DIV04_29035 [Escherichia coli]